MAAPRSLSDAETRVKSFSEGELRALSRDGASPAGLGPYRFLRRLGVGGMAEVFLATAEREGSPQVVVKRILPQLASQGRFLEMFRREARVAMRLDHPNIVKVYGLIEDGGEVGLVMEYLEGLTLYDLAVQAWDGGRSLPLEPLVKMLVDAARALHFAHHLADDQGATKTIVHRDVSPDNLLVTKQGVTKLLDFGVAKPDDDHNLTRAGQVKGKVSFMSPEQARGEKLDGRSDLFSLGISFYWLLTGIRPFDRESPVATMEAVIQADIPRPTELNRMVPRELELIVLRLLERDRRFRTATGLELATQLDQLLRRVPRDHMSPARLLENVLDMEASEPRPWPVHVAVPSVDWVSGERKALTDPSSPRAVTGEWTALQTLQLPVYGRSELMGGSSVFTNVSHEAPAPSPLTSSAGTAPIEDVSPTIPLFVDEGVVDTARVHVVPGLLGALERELEPPTVPMTTGPGASVSSSVPTLDSEDPLSGPVTLLSAPDPDLLELPLPPNTGEPDTDPEPIPPITLEVPALNRSVSVPTIPPVERSRPKSRSYGPLVAGAAVVSLMTFAALAWIFLAEGPAPLETSIATVASLGDEDTAGSPVLALAPATEDATATVGVEVPEATNTTVKTDVEAPTPTPPPSVIPVEDHEKRRPPAQGKRRPRKDEQSVRLVGPAHITWKHRSTSLGKSGKSVQVPVDVDRLTAIDSRRGVRANVPIEGGLANYDTLLSEELVVRVRPWAKVWLGDEALGLTPLKPIAVTPGRYKLKLEWEGKVREHTVRVKKGAAQVIVNVDMRVDEE